MSERNTRIVEMARSGETYKATVAGAVHRARRKKAKARTVREKELA